MKTLKKIFLAIVIIIVLLVIVAFFLPMTYHVERSTVMKGDKALIYDLTSNLGKWDIWTPWTKKIDSTAVFELIGSDGQVGTLRKWDGKVIGNGQMTLTQLIPGELVAYDLSFQKGKYTSKGKLIIEAIGDSNKVSWTDDGNLGYNPISRYMGLFMGKMMNPEFDKGLAKLKKVVEERKDWPKIEETKMESKPVLVIYDLATSSTCHDKMVMGIAFGEIMACMKKNKSKQTGFPFAIYFKWDSLLSVMNKVEKGSKGSAIIQINITPEQNVIKSVYFGPYDKTGPTYNALMQYIKEGNKEMVGGPWEIYITNPMEEKDTLKWQMDIVFPVK